MLAVSLLASLLATALGAAPAQEEKAAPALAALESVTPAQAENLVLLGKVWGLLKYHHPLVTGGEIDWDEELLRELPLVLAAPDRARGNAELLAWGEQLGEPAACAPCAEGAANLHLEAPIAWIEDEARLGRPLAELLQRVHANRPAGEQQHHVSFVNGVGNPVFENEKAYDKVTAPDAGLRLLALFRYWNIIAYWFPYRDVIGEDWDAVLAEFVPRIVAARDPERYQLEIMALIVRVNDTHANLWSSIRLRPPRGDSMLPARVRFVEGKAIVAGPRRPAAPTALRIGDEVLALDGRPLAELMQGWPALFAASNEPTRLRDYGRVLTWGPAGPARVTVARDGATLELEEERLPFERFGDDEGEYRHDLDGETFRLLTPEIGYLKLSTLAAAEIPDVLEAAKGTRALVIDLRNYPKEFVVFHLGQHLVAESTPFARFTASSASNPGAFAWTEPLRLEPAEPRYGGRVVILLDEISQSQSEYTAMAFRVAPGALVVGSTTAGADGNVSSIALPGGLRTMISGIGVFYPDKTPTQRVGIVPDVVARPTIAGLRAGRDEVLEAGLRAVVGSETSDDAIQDIVRKARGVPR